MTTTTTAPAAKQTESAVLIESAVRNGLCTGCGICASLAAKDEIQMKLSSEGYLRPVIRGGLASINVKVLRDTCPALHVGHARSAQATHPLWGPLVSVRAGHATDPVTRNQGSSGGVLSAISAMLLASKRVAFVAQIAVSHDDPLRNALQLSRSKEEVLRAAGSRYAPSSPLSELRELLERGEKFAFVGKPCDVAALRRYALHDKRVNELVPYMLSFMCAGMPSIKGTYALLEQLGADRDRLTSFRYRGDGWPGMARAVQDDGQVFETDYNSSWGKVLGNYLQFRCKICADGTGEFADITCADAWYGKDGYPDFTEREGRSLVLSRTPAGEALIKEALENGSVALENLPVDDIARMQPYQVTRKKVVLGRTIATRLARGQSPSYRKMGLIRASLMANPIEWLRHAWGTYRRAKGEQP